MKKWPYVIFISLFLLLYLNPVFAGNEKGNQDTIQKNIKEILNSINQIIKNSIELAEEELKKLRNNLKDKGSTIKKETEDTIAKGLKSALDKLKRLEMALNRTLTDKKNMTKEKLNQYLKDLDEIEKKIGGFRDKVKKFSDGVGKEGRSLKDSTVKKTQDVLKEIERALDKMEKRIKRQRQIDKTDSA